MDPYELALRKELGLEVPQEEGTDLFQPIRTFFGATQGVVPRALSGLFPETYAKAQQETAQNLNVQEGAPWYEQVEAAPGAGDVLAQTIPESVRQSAVGRAVGPAGRLVGNILGDPTTYTPFILGKAAKGLAGTKALAATEAMKAATTARAVEGVDAGLVSTAEAARAIEAAKAAEIPFTARAVAAESPLRSQAYLLAEAVREAEPWAMGAAAAVAYGPEVVRSAYEGAKGTLEAASQGDVEEALVSGANTLFMAGLGTLMGKGLLDVGQAKRALTRKLADDGIIPDMEKLTRERAAAMVEPPAQAGGFAEPSPEFQRRYGGAEGPGFRMEPQFPEMPPPELRGPVGERGAPEFARTPLEQAPTEADAIRAEIDRRRALNLDQELAKAEDYVRRTQQTIPELAMAGVEPTPIVREPAPPAPRRKGTQLGLPFEGEGTEVKRPPTRAERAAAERQALEQKVAEAMGDEQVPTLIEAEVRKLMTDDLQDLAGGKKTAGLGAQKKLFDAADPSDPAYAKWRDEVLPMAVERVKDRFRKMAKGGLDPIEQLQRMRDQAEAARIDAEERAAIQAEAEPAPAVPKGSEPSTPPTEVVLDDRPIADFSTEELVAQRRAALKSDTLHAANVLRLVETELKRRLKAGETQARVEPAPAIPPTAPRIEPVVTEPAPAAPTPPTPIPEAPAATAPTGTVRLYRAETRTGGPGVSDWIKDHPTYKNTLAASGRWFTDDIEEARYYLQDNPGAKLVEVEVPAAEVERYRVSNLPEVPGGKNAAENPRAFSRRPEKEFFLPKDMAERARGQETPVEPSVPPVAEPTTPPEPAPRVEAPAATVDQVSADVTRVSTAEGTERVPHGKFGHFTTKSPDEFQAKLRQEGWTETAPGAFEKDGRWVRVFKAGPTTVGEMVEFGRTPPVRRAEAPVEPSVPPVVEPTVAPEPTPKAVEAAKVDPGVALEQAVRHLAKTPEEAKFVEGHPELMSRIQTRLREVEGSVGKGLDQSQTRGAIHGVVRGLLNEERARLADLAKKGKEVPSPAGTESQLGRIRAGEIPEPIPGQGAPGAGAKTGSVVRQTTEGPGGAPRAEAARKERAAGKGLSENAKSWLTVLHPNIKESGVPVRQALERYVGQDLGTGDGKKLTAERADMFSRYTELYDKNVEGGMDPVDARAAAIKATQTGANANAHRNVIGAIEKKFAQDPELKAGLVKRALEIQAEETGKPVPKALPRAVEEAGPTLDSQGKAALRGHKLELDGKIQLAVQEGRMGELEPLLIQYLQMAKRRPARLGAGQLARDLGDQNLKNYATLMGIPGVEKIRDTERLVEAIAKHQGLDFQGIASAAGFTPRKLRGKGVAVPEKVPEGARIVPDGFDKAVGGEKKGVRPAVGKGGTRILVERHPGGAGWRVRFDPERKPTSIDGFKQDLKALMEDPNVLEIEDPLGVTPGPGVKGWRPAMESTLEDLHRTISQEIDENGDTFWRLNKTPEAGIARMESVDAIREADAAKTASMPDEQLSGRQRAQRSLHYKEDEAKGLDVGDEMVGVDHDRRMGDGFVALAADRTKGVLKVAKGIVDELVGILEPKTKVRFRGLTASPYARGLYVETQKEGARIFLNVVDAVYAGASPREAAENVVHALIHETAHVADTGHASKGFKTTAQYIDDLVKSSKKYDEYVARVEKELTPVYEKIQNELVGQHKQARVEINGESWRGAEAVEGVPARAATGSAEAKSNLAGGGAKAPPGGSRDGLQRGLSVPGGLRGPAGELRGPAPDRAGAAPRPAQGEAARSEAWSDLGQDEALIARLEGSDGVAEGEAVEAIKKLEADKQLPVTAGDKLMMDYAANWARAASDAEIQQILKTAPDTRGRPGVQEGGINMLVGLEGVSDRAKATLVKYGNLRTEHGLAARSKVRTFEEVSAEVRELLGVKTKSEYVELMKRRGGGLDDTQELALRTIRDEFVRKEDDLSRQFEEATSVEEAGKILAEYEKAKRNSAAAASVLMDRLTGTARGLAMARWKGLSMDPVKMRRLEARAKLVEMLRTRVKDPSEVNRRADELLGMMEDVKGGRVSGVDFWKAFRAAMRKPGMFGGKWPEWRDKFLEFFKAGLLGWPSEVANVSSNALFLGTRRLEDTLAALLDAGFVKLGGAKDRAVWLEETGVATRMLRRALAEGLPVLGQEELKLFKLKGGNVARMLEQGALIQDLLGSYGAIEGAKGNFLRFHFDSMQNWDDFFKHLSRIDTLGKEVYRGLKKGGPEFQWIRDKARTGEKAVETVDRIVGEIREAQLNANAGRDYNAELLEKAVPFLKKGDDLAAQDTFQKPLRGGFLGVQQALSAHPMSGLFVPFFRTPSNIVLETLDRTPLGFFKLMKKWKDLDQAGKMQELAKPLMGSSIMGLMATMAMGGEITGGGPLSFEEREALQATGWQPYSFRVGDQWVSYQRMEPLSSIVGMAVDMVEAYKTGDMASGAETAQKVADSIAENLTNKTFLSGLSALTGAISDPKRELGTFVKQMEASLVPNSLGFAPFGHLARAMDPIFRQQEAFTFDPMVAKLPFLSETLPPSYGPTGQERERPGSFPERLISPFARRTAQSGPLALGSEELIRVGAVPKAPMRYWTSPQGFRVPLRPEERQALAKAMEEVTTMVGQRLVNDPYYKSLPKDENDPRYVFGQKTQQDMVKRMIGKYRSQVLKRLMPTLKARTREVYRESRVEA